MSYQYSIAREPYVVFNQTAIPGAFPTALPRTLFPLLICYTWAQENSYLQCGRWDLKNPQDGSLFLKCF